MNLIFNNLISFFSKHKKRIITYILIVLIIFASQIILQEKNPIELFYNTLGLNCNSLYNESLLKQIYYLANIGFLVIFTISQFTDDIRMNASNIFLRTNVSKWMISKIASIIINTIVVRLIAYLIITVILIPFKLNIGIALNIFIVDILYFLIIEMVILTIYIIAKKIKAIIVVVAVALITIIKYLPFNILALTGYAHYLAIILLTIVMITFILFKRSYISVFEEELK